MAKTSKTTTTETPAPTGPVDLRYVGPAHVESERYGALEPGRVYQEADAAFASYLLDTLPEHWTRA